MNKTIYLIRHGQARAGTADYDRLSILGERQASLLGSHMKDQACLPEEVWSGSLRRQQQSAQHFLQASGLDLAVRVEPRLNEYDHRAVHHHFHPDGPSLTPAGGADEDLPVNMSYSTYSAIINNWASNNLRSAPREKDQRRRGHTSENLESWEQFKKRTISAMLDIARASNSSRLALFTSGGVISAIAGQLENRDDEHIPALIWDMHNASVNTVAFRDGSAALLGLNDIEHLQSHPDPALVTKI